MKKLKTHNVVRVGRVGFYFIGKRLRKTLGVGVAGERPPSVFLHDKRNTGT